MTGMLIDSPFNPGSGLSPPFLAGRSEEQMLLKNYLRRLQSNRGAPHDVLVVGPRGNGKTVLLDWFENTIGTATAATGYGIDALFVTPEQLGEPADLLRKLTPEDKFKPDEIGFDVKLIRATWSTARTEAFLADALIARCRKRALVLMIDEAHTLDPEVGRALLNASQHARRKGPFLLVLAGTPGLPSHLDAMGATFWDRGKQVGIGLLDKVGAEQALTKPFEDEAGITFEAAALDEALGASQHYPYFLQLWGDALWAAAATNDERQVDPAVAGRVTVIGMSEVEQAQPEFEQEQAVYYEQRRQQLEDQGLLPAAAAVGQAYVGRHTISENEVDKVLTDVAVVSSRCPRDFRLVLRDMGYIWSPPGAEDNYEPGIPILMNYIMRKVRLSPGDGPAEGPAPA